MTRILNLVAIMLACAGIFIAGVYSSSYIYNVDVPCGIASGCNVVKNHPSSMVGSIPVAYIGLLGYALILGLGIMRAVSDPARSGPLLKAGFVLSAFGALVSVVLQYISFSEIKATCSWCVASAVVMGLLFIVHSAMLQSASKPVKARIPDDIPEGKAEIPAKSSTFGFDLGLIAVLLIATVTMTGFEAMKVKSGMKRQEIVLKTSSVGSVENLLKDAHTMGDANAPITVLEFADLYCPACRSSYSHMKNLVNEHPGKIRWAFRHFPLFQKEGHENAMKAAIMSEIAAKKGRFFDFLQAVFENDPANVSTETKLYEILESLNVSAADARESIEAKESPEFNKVYGDMQMADALGVQLTPTFLVIVNGENPIAVDRTGLDAMLTEPRFREILGK